MRNDPASCPLCKQQLGTARSLPLWPGDVKDLDTYVAHRNRRVAYQIAQQSRRPAAPATAALDRHMSRELQGELLGRLMDFRQHINAYVMAVNNVSMSTYGGEDRIFRLFMDVSQGEKDKQVAFESSMEALSTATNILNETVGTMEGLRADMEVKSQQISEEYSRMREKKKSLDRHMEVKAMEEQRMGQEHARVRTLELHLKRELQDVERTKARMESERQSYMREAREKETEALKARLESAQRIAQSKGDALSEVSKMKEYVLEQEALRIQAENSAREAKRKSAFLADRNKLLSDKLNASRRELRGRKARPSQERRLEQPQVKAEGDDSHRQSSRNAWQGSDDDFLEVGSSLSAERSSLLYPGSRTDSAIVIDDDLDAEFDDGNYPMPGFLQVGSSSTSRGASSQSSLQPPAHGHGDEDGDDDESIQFVGEKRRRGMDNSDLVQTILAGRLALGPKQRAR